MFSLATFVSTLGRRSLRALGLALFLSGVLLAPPAAFAVDVNSASPEQLQTVRGIGPKTAQTIIAERDRGGRYQSITDLSERVKGIGPKRAAAMQAAGLSVDELAPAAAPAAQ